MSYITKKLIIFKLILTKPGLINNYLVLLMSNINFFLCSNVLNAIQRIISCRNQLKQSKNKSNLFMYSYLVSLVFLIQWPCQLRL